MSHLTLAWLGHPVLRHGGQIVTFRTRKALALLIYLSVAGGRHSRDKIAALFWPESDPAHGRAMLRNTLLYLRQALGDDRPAHLLVERETLGFQLTPGDSSDLRTVEAAVQAAEGAPAPADDSLPGDLVTRLERAAALCRGPFLDGFSLGDSPDFDEWAAAQRVAWQRIERALLDRLADVQAEGGALDSALATVGRCVILDPLDEAARLRQMQLLVALGDRPAALRAYDTWAALLAAELRTRPGAEVSALAARIRAALPGSPLGGPRVIARPPAAPPRAPELDLPLAGRQEAFVQLVASYRTVEASQAAVFCLLGEAGIGKTRLATAFLAWAAGQGADVLQGRAFETGGRLPYQPLVEMLRPRIDAENAPADLLSDAWLVELSRLLPELRDRYPDLPLYTPDETTAQVRLFEAVTRVGQALAERAPVVLFIDDVQWADAASLDALQYGARRWAESRTPLMLVLCLRSEAVATTPSLARWLAEMARSLQIQRWALGPLTLADTRQLLTAAFTAPAAGADSEPPATELDRFARWLLRETAGQPFYLVETFKTLVERGVLVRVESTGRRLVAFSAGQERGWERDESILPHGVRTLIRQRLELLSPDARAVLSAGAVLGHDFPFEWLCQVADVRETDALPALDEVLALGLLSRDRTPGGYSLTAQPAAPEAYSFAHDKIRDVVYTEAGDTRRRLYHRRALATLTTAGAAAAQRLPHALAADLPESAFALALEAGVAAMQVFAVRDAQAHYEQALQLLQQHWELDRLPPGIGPRGLRELYAPLGRIYELTDQWDRAGECYRALLAFAQTQDAPALECLALNRLAVRCYQTNPQDAAPLLEAALQAARRGEDTAGLAETEWNLAHMRFSGADPTGALTHGRRALALARAAALPELIARSLNVIAYAKIELCQWAAAEAEAREAAALYTAQGNRAMEVDCLLQIASIAINTGQAAAGLSTARTAEELSQAIENHWGLANSALCVVAALLDLGAYDILLAAAHDGVATAEVAGAAPLIIYAHANLGAAQRTLLDLHSARATHETALRLSDQRTAGLFTPLLATELCADCALTGDWPAAHAYALRAIDSREQGVLGTRPVRWYETAALCWAGDLAQAAAEVERFRARIGANRRYAIPYLRARAALAESRGARMAAIRHLRAAAALAENLRLPREQWDIEAALAAHYLAAGRPALAEACFARATAILHKLAARIGEAEQRARFLAVAQTLYPELGRAAASGAAGAN